ncbi:hypothetical protein Tco_0948949 [Tanacetum coccineum]
MEGNDDGQDSNKNKLIFNVKMIDSGSTVGKKPVKDKKTTKRKKTASPSIGRTLKINEMLRKKNAEIEAKRIAEEEEAAKDKEEEEETEDDENVEKEVEKNVVELANEAATKNDVDNMENDVEDEEAKSADEEANLVEEQESEQADNEEDSEENDDINQIFNNIQTMPFLNTATRSNKNQVGKGLTKTVVDESLSEMNKEAKKKKREEQIEKKRKLGQKKKEKQEKEHHIRYQ